MKRLKKKSNSRVYFNKTRHRIFESTSPPKGGSPKSLTQKQVSSFPFINKIFFFLFIFFLPTQLGKHFFPSFSYLNGVRVDYLSPTIYLTDIIIFFLLLLNIKALINFFKNKKLLFGIGLFLISVLFAKNQEIAIYRFIKIIEFLIVFVLGKDLFKTIKEKTILITLLFTGAFQLFLSIFQLVYRHSIQGLFYFFGERLITLSTPGVAKATLNGIEFLRSYGTFSHPNSMAGFFLLLYFFVLTKNSFSKYLILKYLSLFVFSILIFISFSKIAIITYLILNTLYWILNTRIKCLPCKISRIIIPLIISLIFLQAVTDPLTVDKRIELFKNSLTILKNNLWYGAGLGNYLIAQSHISSKYPLFFNQPVHNIFLLFVTEMGIIISGFFLVKLLPIIKKNIIIFLVIFLTGFFDHYWLTLQQNFLLLAFIYGSVSMAFFVDRFSLRS